VSGRGRVSLPDSPLTPGNGLRSFTPRCITTRPASGRQDSSFWPCPLENRRFRAFQQQEWQTEHFHLTGFVVVCNTA